MDLFVIPLKVAHNLKTPILPVDAYLYSWSNQMPNDILILFVDDADVLEEHPSVLYLRSTIESCKVEQVFNGRAAIEYIKKATPDLILLDIEMPKMDGFETCKELKKSRHFNPDTKIVMFTIHDGGGHEKRSYRSGVDLFVDKEIPQKELLEKIVDQLRRSGRTVNLVES